MSVKDILEKNQFTVTIDGIDFVSRRIQSYMSLEILGADAMAMLSEGGEESPWEKFNYKKQVEFVKSYLKLAMVSPSLGKETNVDDDVISFHDLGEYANELFGKLMDDMNSDAEVFPESLEVQEE